MSTSLCGHCWKRQWVALGLPLVASFLVRRNHQQRYPRGGGAMSEPHKTEQTESQGLAVASLVLGILAIITCLVWYIGIVLGVLAIIFGAVSVKKRGRKKAIAGIATGSIGVILSLLIVWVVSAAVPSLQKSQRDTARKNDVSALVTDVLSFQTENRGQLPSANDLTTSSLAQVTSIAGEGEPTTDKAVLKTGVNCDGVSSTRNYSITILLESGSPYCQGS